MLAKFGEVTAFEREAALVARGRSLLPDLTWHQVDRLDHLPAGPGSFDLALCFTVLQHLGEEELVAVTAELKRVVDGAVPPRRLLATSHRAAWSGAHAELRGLHAVRRRVTRPSCSPG